MKFNYDQKTFTSQFRFDVISILLGDDSITERSGDQRVLIHKFAIVADTLTSLCCVMEKKIMFVAILF